MAAPFSLRRAVEVGLSGGTLTRPVHQARVEELLQVTHVT